MAHNRKLVNHLIYNSFGEVILKSNPSIDTRYLYTGREFDSETGLYYYRARYYDAQVGRFISEDPISFAGGEANLYKYVANSPVNTVDPLGLYGSKKYGYGKVMAQVRLIRYSDNGVKFTTNLQELIDAHKLNSKVSIQWDRTFASIEYSDNNPPRKSTPNAPSKKPTDVNGHIVGHQLCGTEPSINNFYAQDRNINNRAWKAYENDLRRRLSNSNQCSSAVFLGLAVNLSYAGREPQYPLRPTAISAIGIFTDGQIVTENLPN